ncbi:uncharacterized protein VTP21DRAFT_11392 [Calcarisporiella thermophila]|uniref:uncharacterized protein n=1 Tax=Calcarisporiella thermophila TaxID=911321 RepID=UPI003743A5A3
MDPSFHELPQRFQPAIIVLSYIVSVIGAYTSLELLHRRTGRGGLINWLLLFGSALSMGGCGIWSMHFIGNNALTLGNAQLIYTPGFTLLSLLVAIVAVGVGFYFVGSVADVSLLRLGLVGCLTGLAIPAMHYVGQLGIAYYVVRYDAGVVVASFFIGITATSVALIIFFYLNRRWKDRWYKRFGCATIMGAAVCGMHYCGMSATHYFSNGSEINVDVVLTSEAMVGMIAAIATSICLVLILLTILAQRRTRKLRERVKKIVLACVYFDEMGRILVYNHGMIPVHTIENEFYKMGHDAELSPGHSLFRRLFRLTWSWREFSRGLEGEEMESLKNLKPRDKTFVERFHQASQRLAHDLGVPLEEVGILYDQMITTGYIESSSKSPNNKKFFRLSFNSTQQQENQPQTFELLGRGQMLFLVRRLSTAQRHGQEHFASRGFRFGPPAIMARHVGPLLQVPSSNLRLMFEDMYRFITEGLQPFESEEMHVGAFVAWPTLGGLQIGVDATHRAQIPTVELLPPDYLDEKDGLVGSVDHLAVLEDIVSNCSGRTADEVIKILREASGRDKIFSGCVAHAISRLTGKFKGDVKLILHSRLIRLGQSGIRNTLMFKAIVPLHEQTLKNLSEVRPMSFALFQVLSELVNPPRIAKPSLGDKPTDKEDIAPPVLPPYSSGQAKTQPAESPDEWRVNIDDAVEDLKEESWIAELLRSMV